MNINNNCCLLLASAASALSAATASAATERPNVLIVVADDQGYGDFSAHGNTYISTPNMDALHDTSVRLTDFHVCPTSTPTRGALLTGLDPMHNGAWSWGFGHANINTEVTTMPEIFSEAGYRTAHFGKWHLGDNYPFRSQDIGFQETVTFGGASTQQSAAYWQTDNFDDHYKMMDGSYKQFKGYCTDIWFDLSMDFMEKCNDNDEPFMLYLPTNAAHDPKYVATEYSKPYEHLGENVSTFFGMIATIDNNLGRLDAFLREQNLFDNTIVIYMTDNGGTYGTPIYNAGMKGKKGNYYEGGHRTACFIRWPEGGLEHGKDMPAMTTVQDLLPTIMDLCEVKAPKSVEKKFDGVSIAKNLKNVEKPLDERMLVIQWSPLDYPAYGDAAVLWNQWRWISFKGKKELYDIKNDPAQERNIIKEHPEVVAKLKAHYDEWWEGVQPVVSTYYRPIIGGEVNPVEICCYEWAKRESNIPRANVTQQQTIYDAVNVNGEFYLNFVKSGKYKITLRRYPKEIDFPMRAAYPATKREFASYEECVAMPIFAARLKIDETIYNTGVNATATNVSFEIDVEAGDHTLKSYFLDPAGETLSGGYYVEIELL